jgi:hypothetical protein
MKDRSVSSIPHSVLAFPHIVFFVATAKLLNPN